MPAVLPTRQPGAGSMPARPASWPPAFPSMPACPTACPPARLPSTFACPTSFLSACPSAPAYLSALLPAHPHSPARLPACLLPAPLATRRCPWRSEPLQTGSRQRGRMSASRYAAQTTPAPLPTSPLGRCLAACCPWQQRTPAPSPCDSPPRSRWMAATAATPATQRLGARPAGLTPTCASPARQSSAPNRSPLWTPPSGPAAARCRTALSLQPLWWAAAPPTGCLPGSTAPAAMTQPHMTPPPGQRPTLRRQCRMKSGRRCR